VPIRMTPKRLIRELERWAKSNGGAVIAAPRVVVEQHEMYRYSTDRSIDWKHKVVYYDPDTVLAYALIHEVAHVFASRRPPDETDDAGLIGWEYALARRMRVVEDWSATLIRADIRPAEVVRVWGAHLLEKRTRSALTTAWNQAAHSGLIENGKPVSVRTK